MAITAQGHTVGHIPREISRATYYFTRHGGTLSAVVIDIQPKISPIEQGGLEIPIMVLASSTQEELVNRLIKLIQELYIHDVDNNDANYNADTETDTDYNSDIDNQTVNVSDIESD